MWAHYAQSHRGAVIEIDAAAAGMTDANTNMIPAHFGSVVYVSRFNAAPYQSKLTGVSVAVGATHNFVLDHYEKWQRLFLTKPLDWAYEEEVRVVKCVKGVKGQAVETESGVFSVFPGNDGTEVHAFHIPPEAITGVTVGLRASAKDLAELKALHPGIAFTKARLLGSAYAISLASV